VKEIQDPRKNRLAAHKIVLVEEVKRVLHGLGYPPEEQICLAEDLGERFLELAGVKM
jgi:hypothetical protein